MRSALFRAGGECVHRLQYAEKFQWERDREQWELENFPEGEADEMTELFVARGMLQDDAEQAITLMSRYKVKNTNIALTQLTLLNKGAFVNITILYLFFMSSYVCLKLTHK